MTRQLRWGIIGIGRFGRVHARVLQSLPGSELVAISNRNPERLAEAAADLGIDESHAFPDFRDLLANPEIDVVSITTHWLDHHEIALAALAAGKHVLLEKPMAATSAQCREILAAVESAPGSLMVGHICRFDPRVTLAKEAIDAGRIGRIISMHAKRNLPKAPGNIRLDKISPLVGDGIHDVDLMMWFLGGRAPDTIYARNVSHSGHRYPDLGWAMLNFGDDAVGVVETAWCLPESVPTVIDATFEIIGTEGKLTIDCGHTGLSITDGAGTKQPDTVYWPTQQGQVIGALQREIAYFADCVRHGKQPEVITPIEAAKALAVVEAAELSSEKREPVAFSFL
ncbi:MAG: Gfo/Idh/MocA family oxidoreductase [Verrucomicrobiae bacterium]|nr:Gfo/Idh/MocA family oxidoreductase [Verrucomicrobiae bacterium]